MNRNIRLTSLLLALTLLLTLFSVSPALAAGDDRFEQPTPFGIAHREDSEPIGVYKKAGNTKTSASLADYTLCSILSTQSLGGATWYQVSYFDASMKEQQGFVKGEEFYQLTVAGLISIASDAEASAYLQQFSGLSGSNAFIAPVVASTGVTRSSTETSSTSQREITYVLNKNTKKFHYPWCNSVDDIKAKNRQDFYGSRDEIPKGYVPCKKCNP